MASNGSSSSPKPNPKKANSMDPHSIKHLLDESVSEIVTGRGYTKDVRLSNIRLLVGTVIIAIALVAQFYRKKFRENKDFLIGCIALYIVFNGLLQLIIYKKEKNAILFQYLCEEFREAPWIQSSYPLEEDGDRPHHVHPCVRSFAIQIAILTDPQGSFNSTGLVVSSDLPRFSDLYTLSVASADPKSVSANKAVHFTKSVTKWFTHDGILVEGLFWKDVSKLIDDYSGDSQKNK